MNVHREQVLTHEPWRSLHAEKHAVIPDLLVPSRANLIRWAHSRSALQKLYENQRGLITSAAEEQCWLVLGLSNTPVGHVVIADQDNQL